MIYLSTEDGLRALVHRAVLHSGTLIYASLVGSREEVHAVWGALSNSQPVRLSGRGQVSPPWQGLKFRQARLARGVTHGVLESRHEEYFCGRKEQKAEWLASRLELPILPEWVGFLESLPRVREAQERLWAYGTAALYLPDYRVSEVREALQAALGRGELPLSTGIAQVTGQAGIAFGDPLGGPEALHLSTGIAGPLERLHLSTGIAQVTGEH